MTTSKFKVGADPEFFLKKNGQFMSAFGLLHGTKEEPEIVPKGGLQIDGMAVEFNIDPANNVEEFIDNIGTVLAEARKRIPQDAEFDFNPTVHLSEEFLSEQPEKAVELGCDPDFNAYTGEENPRPEQMTPMRTAGGHVHVGWCNGADTDSVPHNDMCRRVIKAMDLYLGVPSVLFDADTERRSLYGQAGAYRPKSYGVEYRTLSSKWVQTKSLQKLVYNNTQLALQNVRNIADIIAGLDIDVNAIINSSDKKKALEICKTLGIPYEVQSEI